MEEKYCLFDILESEKNMAVNMAISLNEASNNNLYKKWFSMFQAISENVKELFYLAYNNGWYNLEEAQETKITQAINKLEKEQEQVK